MPHPETTTAYLSEAVLILEDVLTSSIAQKHSDQSLAQLYTQLALFGLNEGNAVDSLDKLDEVSANIIAAGDVNTADIIAALDTNTTTIVDTMNTNTAALIVAIEDAFPPTP